MQPPRALRKAIPACGARGSFQICCPNSPAKKSSGPQARRIWQTISVLIVMQAEERSSTLPAKDSESVLTKSAGDAKVDVAAAPQALPDNKIKHRVAAHLNIYLVGVGGEHCN